MALKIKRKSRAPEEIPLASTSDIAFLLIIFFLTASALLEFRGVQLPLPKPDSPPMQILKKNLFKVYLDESGEFHHEDKAVQLEELRPVLRGEASANPEMVVVLKVNGNAPSQQIPAFIKLLNDESIVRFSMTMEEER